MKKEILIATENLGKANEIREIFGKSKYKLHFLYEFKEKLGDLKIKECAQTFEGNALIKAIVVGDLLGMITLADDSGLCVDMLDGRPGVYSARYSKKGTDEENNKKVLLEMKKIPSEKRSCHYECTVAVYDPKTKFLKTVTGQWDGRIALSPKGTKSFGYAPIFLSRETKYKKTNAEFDPEYLININHRGKAFRKAIKVLNKYIK
jgi:XTP/dITP diphosphohydrolase